MSLRRMFQVNKGRTDKDERHAVFSRGLITRPPPLWPGRVRGLLMRSRKLSEPVKNFNEGRWTSSGQAGG